MLSIIKRNVGFLSMRLKILVLIKAYKLIYRNSKIAHTTMQEGTASDLLNKHLNG